MIENTTQYIPSDTKVQLIYLEFHLGSLKTTRKMTKPRNTTAEKNDGKKDDNKDKIMASQERCKEVLREGLRRIDA